MTITNLTYPMWKKSPPFHKFVCSIRAQTDIHNIVDLFTTDSNKILINAEVAFDKATTISANVRKQLFDICNLYGSHSMNSKGDCKNLLV